jgi:hypothetical protein
VFLNTLQKKIQRVRDNRDRCCHLALSLQWILFHSSFKAIPLIDKVTISFSSILIDSKVSTLLFQTLSFSSVPTDRQTGSLITFFQIRNCFPQTDQLSFKSCFYFKKMSFSSIPTDRQIGRVMSFSLRQLSFKRSHRQTVWCLLFISDNHLKAFSQTDKISTFLFLSDN